MRQVKTYHQLGEVARCSLQIKSFLYWAFKRSDFQEAIHGTNLQALTNTQRTTINITFSVCITWLEFIHVQTEVALMAIQFISVEIFFFLRKFIGPKNPLMCARIAYFVFLRRSPKLTWRPSLKAAIELLAVCLNKSSYYMTPTNTVDPGKGHYAFLFEDRRTRYRTQLTLSWLMTQRWGQLTVKMITQTGSTIPTELETVNQLHSPWKRIPPP